MVKYYKVENKSGFQQFFVEYFDYVGFQLFKDKYLYELNLMILFKVTEL